MKHKIRRIVLIGVVMLVGTLISFGQNKEERKLIELEVTELGDKFCEFMIAGNVDSIAANFSPNCHFILEFEPIIEKREEVEKFYKKFFKSGNKITEYSFSRDEMKVYDELVLEFGTVDIKYTKGGEDIRVKYNYSFVWKESKSDRYRIRSAMWNSPANPCE